MNHAYSWFLRFVLYNLVFMGFQCFYTISQSNRFFQTPHLPASIYAEIIGTLCIHIVLYLMLSALQTTLLWGLMQRHWKLSAERWQILIWSLSIAALLSSNGYFFPLSVFSRMFLPELPRSILVAILFFSLLPLILLAMNTVLLAIQKRPRTIILLSLLPLMSVWFYSPIETRVNSQPSIKPNIILIGVDSLPPISITPQNTPSMAQFIKESVLFKETISPLARTYAAWSTILTGLYPHHHGARYNLMPANQVQSADSIAWRLQRAGYQTLFATDDRRFNNLGPEFGFENIIGPKLGANDFLLGTFNDFPLSNLLINVPLARRIFPYNYMNRASHFSYYPQTFDHELQHTLTSRQQTLPLFLAVHFTLPHWPYAFALSSPAQVKDEYSMSERGELFAAALHQADQQVEHLLRVLQERGYLKNSLIVLLSDHGETLYTPGSRQTQVHAYQGHGSSQLADYFKRKTSTALEMSAGHGSDLLSADQYHCVLAWQIYKNSQRITQTRAISTRVSLIDIAPTLEAFSNIPKLAHVDGISLLNSLVNQNSTTLPERAFIMESGMLPNQFLTRDQARRLGQQLFMVSKHSGQLQIRKSALPILDAMKLYAIIEGNWVLALYPDDTGYIPITQRLTDGAWTDELGSEFAKSSPAISMLERVRLFYNEPFNINHAAFLEP